MAKQYTKEQWIACAVILIIGIPLIMWAKSSGSDKAADKLSDAESSAIRACSDMVLDQAAFPSSVDLHLVTGATVDRLGARDTLRVFLKFDAKNALGAELPYRAICFFDTEPPTINIAGR
ncbi:MAG: hypothetical protein V7756_09545 [Halopseudomonas sp.]|uniref:hypothetical protein n=1 Tax=Halopseudomonas sp. TaxID=2901191 RepID=UPI003002E3EE